MAGIWTYLIPIVVLIALCAWMLSRRRPPSLDEQNHCSKCATPMSLRRVPIFQSLKHKGQWMCLHCDNRIKSRKGVTGTTT